MFTLGISNEENLSFEKLKQMITCRGFDETLYDLFININDVSTNKVTLINQINNDSDIINVNIVKKMEFEIIPDIKLNSDEYQPSSDENSDNELSDIETFDSDILSSTSHKWSYEQAYVDLHNKLHLKDKCIHELIESNKVRSLVEYMGMMLLGLSIVYKIM
jgi:hypothetical protein